MSDTTEQQIIAAEAAAAVTKKATSRKRKVAELMDPNQEKPKRAAKKQKVSIVNNVNAKKVGTNIVSAGSVTTYKTGGAIITQHSDTDITFQKGGMFIRCKGQPIENIPFVINGRQFTIIRRDIPDSSESSSDSDD